MKRRTMMRLNYRTPLTEQKKIEEKNENQELQSLKYINNDFIKIYQTWRTKNYSDKILVKLSTTNQNELSTEKERKEVSFDLTNLVDIKKIPFYCISGEDKKTGVLINDQERFQLYLDSFDDLICVNYRWLLSHCSNADHLFLERFLSLILFNARLPCYRTDTTAFNCPLYQIQKECTTALHQHQFYNSNKLSKKGIKIMELTNDVKPFYKNTCILKELFFPTHHQSEICCRTIILKMYTTIESEMRQDGKIKKEYLFNFIRNNFEISEKKEFLFYRISNLVDLFNKIN